MDLIQERTDEYIRFLDQEGFNYWILRAIRTLVKKGSLAVEDDNDGETDHRDELTGEVLIS